MSKINLINKPFEQLHYPLLFEWELLNNCSENNLLECAKFLCQTITKFNDISRAYCSIFTQNKQYEKNIQELNDRCKSLENCSVCLKLQRKLNDQNAVMKTLANIFCQISNESVATNVSSTSKNSLEKAHNIFTQLMVENDDEVPTATDENAVKSSAPVSRKVKSRNSPEAHHGSDFNMLKECAATFMTPKKRLKVNEFISPTKGAFGDSLRSATSPILGKSKIPTKIVNSRSEDITATDDEYLPVIASPGSAPVKIDTSPSLLKGANCSDEKIAISKPDSSNYPVSPETRINKIQRHSISLLQKSNVAAKYDPASVDVSKCKKNTNRKCKSMKQSRLSFSKEKHKLPPLDITLAQNFYGGIRNTSTQRTQDDAMLQAGINASLESSKTDKSDDLRISQQDDDDVITASPSYLHQPVVKWHTIRHQIKKENIEPINKMDISQDATMVFATEWKPVKEEVFSELSNKHVTHLPTTCPDTNSKPVTSETLNIRARTVLKKSSPDIVYKELPVRKKAEKKKLPGWSCSNCKEFYEVAFAGNEDMIRQKMEDCSRHRGKFNPEMRRTPPGFWDLKSPSTEDTEAFNRRNNGD